MLVYADHQLEQFQVLGNIVRVHWDYQQYEVNDMDGTVRLAWKCEEAVVPTNADYTTFVSAINAEGGNGDELAQAWFEQQK